MTTTTKKYDWSDLPCDVLAKIFEPLNDSNLERSRIGAVCTTWRKTLMHLPSPNPIPVFPLKLPVVIEPDIPEIRYRILRQHTLYIIPPNSDTSTTPVLMRIEEIGPKHWKLHNPFLKCPSGLPNPCSVNLLHSRFQQVAKSYVFDASNDNECSTKSYKVTRVNKIVTMKDSGLTVVMCLQDNRIFFLVEKVDCMWRTDIRHDFTDIISFEDEFLFVDRSGVLYKIENPSDPKSFVKVTKQGLLFTNTDVRCMHLVESNGRLYLVVKTNPTSENHPIGIHVFVLEKQSQEWKRVNSLENKVFFLTNDVNFSCSPNDCGRKKGDFICFLDCVMAKDDSIGPSAKKWEIQVHELPKKHAQSCIPPTTTRHNNTADERLLERDKCYCWSFLTSFFGLSRMEAKDVEDSNRFST